jgi:hypothetical protein
MGQLPAEERVELRLDGGGLADQLDRVGRAELSERLERTGHRRLRGEVAPHGVQRDPRQRQLSLAATRCSPA